MVECKREWTSEQLKEIIAAAKLDLEVRDHSYHLAVYEKCFIASDLVEWLISKQYVEDRV